MEKLKLIFESFKAVLSSCFLYGVDENSIRISLPVMVRPSSKFEQITISDSGELVIKLQAKPKDGEANKAVKKTLSKKLGVSASSIEIIRGEKSRNKELLINFFVGKNKTVDYYVVRIKDLVEN